MEFTYKVRRMVLRGTKKSDVEWMGEIGVKKILQQSAQVFAIQLQPINTEVSLQQAEVTDPQLLGLLSEFADIFEDLVKGGYSTH